MPEKAVTLSTHDGARAPGSRGALELLGGLRGQGPVRERPGMCVMLRADKESCRKFIFQAACWIIRLAGAGRDPATCNRRAMTVW